MAVTNPKDISGNTVACAGVHKALHSLLKLKTDIWGQIHLYRSGYLHYTQMLSCPSDVTTDLHLHLAFYIVGNSTRI